MKLEVDAAQDGGPVLDFEPGLFEDKRRGVRTVFAVKEAVAPPARRSLPTRLHFCHACHGITATESLAAGGFGRAQRGVGFLHRCRQGPEPGQRKEPRARRCERRRRLHRPLEELARRRVARHRPIHHRDHAIRRRKAALQPVLGDHHGGSPVLVQASQLPDELVARHGIELRGRLVEHEQRRVVHHRGGDRHALELPAGERVGAAVEQMRHAEAERRLLHRAGHRRRRLAAVLQRQLQLGAHAAHHHLRLGLLEDRAAHCGQLARARGRARRGRQRSARRSPRHRGSAARGRRARAAASTCRSRTPRRAR